MLAGPDATVWTMRRAIAQTLVALGVAGEIDTERTAEDKVFFEEQAKKLAHHPGDLQGAQAAIEAFDLGPGRLNQARVELGDCMLDRSVSVGAARTRMELKRQSGLGADHAFGENISAIVKAKLRIEPGLVLDAATRLDDLAAFDGRDAIKQDLVAHAEKQKALLADRDASDQELTKLKSRATKLVAEAADALAATKGSLDQRFPRQHGYVAAFFLDVAPVRSKAEPEAAEETTG